MSLYEVQCRVCSMRFAAEAIPAEPVCPACAPAMARLRAMGGQSVAVSAPAAGPTPAATSSLPSRIAADTAAPTAMPILLELAPADAQAADGKAGPAPIALAVATPVAPEAIQDDILVLTEATLPPEADAPFFAPGGPPPILPRPPTIVFRFACPVCDVLLEAASDDGGRPTTCPTCGQNFPIPQYDRRSGRVFFDPNRTPPKPKESLAFLHAYACAGRNAPTVIHGQGGEPWIQCARCRTLNPVNSNWCRNCRMPFAVENQRSTSSDRASGASKAGLITALCAVPFAATVVGMFVAAVAFAISAGALMSLRHSADERKRGTFLAGCGAALSAIIFVVAFVFLAIDGF